MVSVLLAAAVGAAWLGAAGFARLRGSLDRLHCGAFIAAASGLPLVVAAALADGVSVRVAKIVLVVLIDLVAGAAVAPAVGRAARVRP